MLAPSSRAVWLFALLGCADANDGGLGGQAPNHLGGGGSNEGAGGAALGAGGVGGSGGLGATSSLGGASTGGASAEGGGGAGQGGSGVCDASACQMDLSSIENMPPGSITLDFEACEGGCTCCSGSSYADPIDSDCISCSVDASLAAQGIARVGGLGTYFVSCIQGNPAAPIQNAALFAGSSSFELLFDDAVSFIGFTGLPTASSSVPTITLEGYNAAGELTGIDSFSFSTPGGDCKTSNPAATFFAFRSCCGPMVRAVVTFSDPNTAIDSITFL